MTEQESENNKDKKRLIALHSSFRLNIFASLHSIDHFFHMKIDNNLPFIAQPLYYFILMIHIYSFFCFVFFSRFHSIVVLYHEAYFSFK